MERRIEITPKGNAVIAADDMPDITLDMARGMWGDGIGEPDYTFRLGMPDELCLRIVQCIESGEPIPGLILYADDSKAYIDIDIDHAGSVYGKVYFSEAPGDWDDYSGERFIEFDYDPDTDKATTAMR